MIYNLKTIALALSVISFPNNLSIEASKSSAFDSSVSFIAKDHSRLSNYDDLIKTGEGFLKENKFSEAEKIFNKAIALDKKRVEAYYGLAVVKSVSCFQTNNFCDEAIVNFNKALEINPKYKKIYYNLSICKSKMGDFKGALIDINKAIAINSSDPDYFENRAALYLILKDEVKACADYKKAIQLGSKIAKEKQKLFCK